MALQQFLQSVTNRHLAKKRHWQEECHDLLRLRDEATVLKLAEQILDKYDNFDAQEQRVFFEFLLTEFRADLERLQQAIDNYQNDPSPLNVQKLNKASAPARRALFEILNMTPGGTGRLVKMRADLLGLLRENKSLKAVDSDLQALFSAWFNRGFLSLEQINWQTPAFVLERLIHYEAVHEITGWTDLQRRVSAGRRCYAFFHPALPNEPIIFVQVALTNELSGSIDQLIRHAPDELAEASANTAIFYSISNCQQGLRGIAFGDLLIKQVVDQIKAELPNIQTFATLSPIPGFGRWLRRNLREQSVDSAGIDAGNLSQLEVKRLASLSNDTGNEMLLDNQHADAEGNGGDVKDILTRLCAHYLTEQKSGDEPLDPVSRFHLRNGARLERINWLGDLSAKGLEESFGLLVNYVYDVSDVTKNHERYIYENSVVASSVVNNLAKHRSRSNES